MFSVYQNFSRPDRELFKVTLDCIACIRSKVHYDQILQFVYSQILQRIPENIQKQFQVIDQTNLQKCNYRSTVIYQVIIAGAVIGAVGSMLASSLSLELYYIGEGKRGSEKVESLYSALLEEVGMILFKITLVYFENQDT